MLVLILTYGQIKFLRSWVGVGVNIKVDGQGRPLGVEDPVLGIEHCDLCKLVPGENLSLRAKGPRPRIVWSPPSHHELHKVQTRDPEPRLLLGEHTYESARLD